MNQEKIEKDLNYCMLIKEAGVLLKEKSRYIRDVCKELKFPIAMKNYNKVNDGLWKAIEDFGKYLDDSNVDCNASRAIVDSLIILADTSLSYLGSVDFLGDLIKNLKDYSLYRKSSL